jgi:hypothetical protein
MLLGAELGPVNVEAKRAGIRLEIVRRLVGRLPHIRLENNAVGLCHRRHHLTRDVFLDRDQILGAQILIVGLAPEYRGCFGIHQPAGYPQLPARDTQAARQHVAHGKLTDDRSRIAGRRDGPRGLST